MSINKQELKNKIEKMQKEIEKDYTRYDDLKDELCFLLKYLDYFETLKNVDAEIESLIDFDIKIKELNFKKECLMNNIFKKYGFQKGTIFKLHNDYFKIINSFYYFKKLKKDGSINFKASLNKLNLYILKDIEIIENE